MWSSHFEGVIQTNMSLLCVVLHGTWRRVRLRLVLGAVRAETHVVEGHSVVLGQRKRQPLRRGRFQTHIGRQHGGADGKAGAAGSLALLARAAAGVAFAIPPRLHLLLDHQDLVVAKVTQQRGVRV